MRIHPRRRSPTALRRDAEGESPRTIVIAFLADVVIGVASRIACLVSGSSARGLSIADPTRAMDELDGRVQQELPLVAEVFVDVMASTRPTNAT